MPVTTAILFQQNVRVINISDLYKNIYINTFTLPTLYIQIVHFWSFAVKRKTNVTTIIDNRIIILASLRLCIQWFNVYYTICRYYT